MAGQHLAGGRNVEELPAPTAHALLRPQRVVIRHDVIDRQGALQPRGGVLDDTAGFLDLLQVGISAARFFRAQPYLHVRDFQTVGVEIDRHLDDIRELMQVLPVHHRIDRQRQFELARPFRGLDLLFMRVPQAGDAVGDTGSLP